MGKRNIMKGGEKVDGGRKRVRTRRRCRNIMWGKKKVEPANERNVTRKWNYNVEKETENGGREAREERKEEN